MEVGEVGGEGQVVGVGKSAHDLGGAGGRGRGGKEEFSFVHLKSILERPEFQM